MTDSFADKWRQDHTDRISESLSEFINGGGATEARDAICDAIMVWQDYHQKELNKWKELAALLNLPGATGSAAQHLQSYNAPSKSIESGL